MEKLINKRISVYRNELSNLDLNEMERAIRVAVVEELEFILDRLNSEEGGN